MTIKNIELPAEVKGLNLVCLGNLIERIVLVQDVDPLINSEEFYFKIKGVNRDGDYISLYIDYVKLHSDGGDLRAVSVDWDGKKWSFKVAWLKNGELREPFNYHENCKVSFVWKTI